MKINPSKKLMCKSDFALFVALLAVVACSNPVSHIPEINPEQLMARQPNYAPYEKTYRMVPYDLITIRYPYHAEQEPKVPISIRPDGQIMLDGVGGIMAAGRTPEELGKDIAEKLSKRLRDPQVVVGVTTFAPRRIYVGGQVKAPGIVQFQGEMTPIQAIFDRGGFTPEAQLDSVILIRDTGGPEPIVGRINVNQGLEDGKPEKIRLVTNDVLYVPMSGIGRADLWVKQHLRDILPAEIIGWGAYGAAS